MPTIKAALLLVLLLAGPSWAAVAYDADTQALQNVSLSTKTFSHTTSGSNRALLVYVALAGTAQTVSTVTYGGTGLTSLGALNLTGTPSGRVELWGMVNPATGANNVVVTLSATNASWDISAISFTGAHQTFASCFTGFQSGLNGATNAFVSLVVTTGQTGDLVSSGTVSTTGNGVAPTSPAVQQWLDNSGSSNTMGSTQAGAASVTLRENWDAFNATNTMGAVAINVAQVSGAAAPVKKRPLFL